MVLKEALNNYLITKGMSPENNTLRPSEEQGSNSSNNLKQAFEECRNRVTTELNRIGSHFAAFQRGSLTVAAMEGLVQKLDELNRPILCELEHQRLDVVRQIALDVLAFCRTEERVSERLCAGHKRERKTI